MFFGNKITQTGNLLNSLLLFLGFSFVASSVYVLNDLKDIEKDKLHPQKCKRPLASGAINIRQGIGLLICCLIIGFSIIGVFIHDKIIIGLVLFYLLQNILYTYYLKRIALVDVTILSIGFVIRLVLGGLVTHTILSHWIVLITFVLAMFLAFAKRLDDFRINQETNVKIRKSVSGYNIEFLNTVIGVLSVVIIITYIMYTISPEIIARFGDYTFVTSIFVILGIIRYLQITMVYHQSGSPTKVLLKDLFLQIIIICWLISFSFLIYIK
jgi:4-hydroxybenzoate polyprenyltransferase